MIPDLTFHPDERTRGDGGPSLATATGEEVYTSLIYIESRVTTAKRTDLDWLERWIVSLTRDEGKTWPNVTPKD